MRDDKKNAEYAVSMEKIETQYSMTMAQTIPLMEREAIWGYQLMQWIAEVMEESPVPSAQIDSVMLRMASQIYLNMIASVLMQTGIYADESQAGAALQEHINALYELIKTKAIKHPSQEEAAMFIKKANAAAKHGGPASC
jgi:hypothetical protein